VSSDTATMDLTQATPGSSPLYVVLAFRPDNSGASQLLNLGNGSVTFIISSVTVTIGNGAPIALPSSTITFGAQVLLCPPMRASTNCQRRVCLPCCHAFRCPPAEQACCMPEVRHT